MRGPLGCQGSARGLRPGDRADLRELSDNALLTRLRPMSRDSSERAAICEVLVERYAHLVRACVRPYRGSPEPAEDLMQLGYVGLLKAINGFDPRVGDSLSAYAAPCVSGEADVLGEDDHAVEHALDMQAVHTHLGDLPEREQRALNLRFYGNLPQAEIGQRLGISQMHVFRLLARSLAYLRDQLSSEPDSDMTPQPPRSSHPLPYQPELTQQRAG